MNSFFQPHANYPALHLNKLLSQYVVTTIAIKCDEFLKEILGSNSPLKICHLKTYTYYYGPYSDGQLNSVGFEIFFMGTIYRGAKLGRSDKIS
jgi:hypothetical protein